MRDTTAQKLATAEREELLRREHEARSAAERANRVKDEFLATVSHELRTPLNAILGWTRMLSAGQVDSERMAHALTVIERNAGTLARFVEDLLDASAIVAGKLQFDIRSMDLSRVVGEAAESIHHSAEEKGVDVAVTIASNLPPISGDPRRLQQVVLNLLSNAVKFTPPGGRISVDLKRSSDALELTVQDTGAGIPAATLPHIFDRFHQGTVTVRRTGGLGLGLTIARQIVQAHHGTIEASSAGEGQGATFVIKLPLGIDASTSREPPSAANGAV
jgi:signal transduction histidine kinase